MTKYINTNFLESYIIGKDDNNKIKDNIKYLLESEDKLDSEDISNIIKLLRKSKLKRILDEN